METEKKPLVYVEGNDKTTENMFIEEGWEISSDPYAVCDLVCFTGGLDVAPSIYRAPIHPKTQYDLERDDECVQMFVDHHKFTPMVGICRGGQFLNVMCGGSLFQHVDGHHKSHKAKLEGTDMTLEVTSSHHQMMLPKLDYGVDRPELILTADESSFRQKFSALTALSNDEITLPDIEALFYREDECLCFQPHPEWVKKGSVERDLFFSLIKTLFKLEGKEECAA